MPRTVPGTQEELNKYVLNKKKERREGGKEEGMEGRKQTIHIRTEVRGLQE